MSRCSDFKEVRDLPTRADAPQRFAELSVVALRRAAQVGDRMVPAGTKATVVAA
jgi:hypothetical protein